MQYQIFIYGAGSAAKESACNAGDLRFHPWVGMIPWKRERLPTPVMLAWRIPWTTHGLAECRTRLNNVHVI